ncbi:hypothetical protein NADFUDRAFT_50338 [Nadsonia fulvescens var. elongata DSM 6958]|uniref:SP-RING-type domain-containing protein n=1 Tax=Nadsonia fulvescens var. elongata DSM 6958 TaxID=857566 RepID=A0A1E3PNI3_9ASCO|nr:hypothetical protein NADFUDRAFT_50338 [Nadsonia fulvescens var. elongata DSM 6958]
MHYLNTGYKNHDTQRIHQVQLLIENARGELPTMRAAPQYNNFQQNSRDTLQQQQQFHGYPGYITPLYNRQVPGAQTPQMRHPNNTQQTRPSGTTQLTPIVFAGSPFYDLQRALLAPFVCPKSSDNRNVMTVQFSLTPDELIKIQSKQFGVYLLACHYDNLASTRRSMVSFPLTTEVHLNSNLVQANFRGIKNKPGTTKPANLSPHININGEVNRLHISFGHVKQEFAFSICLVKLYSIDALVERVRAHPHIEANTTKELIKQLEGDDEDLVSCGTNLSLKCPLSYGRLQVPIRSICCRHVSCFDAASFLMLQEQHPTWNCPLCNKILTFADLSVDDYLIEILSKTKDDDDTIEIQPDGTWVVREENSDMESSPEPNSIKRETSASSTMKREKFDDQSDIEIVDLDDDEENTEMMNKNNAPNLNDKSAPQEENVLVNNNMYYNNTVGNNGSVDQTPSEDVLMNSSVETTDNNSAISNLRDTVDNPTQNVFKKVNDSQVVNGSTPPFGSNNPVDQDHKSMQVNNTNSNLGNPVYNNGDPTVLNNSNDLVSNFSLAPLTFSSPANTTLNLGSGMPLQLPLPYSAPIDSFPPPAANKTIVTSPGPTASQKEISLPSWDQSTLFGGKPVTSSDVSGTVINENINESSSNMINMNNKEVMNGIVSSDPNFNDNASGNNGSLNRNSTNNVDSNIAGVSGITRSAHINPEMVAPLYNTNILQPLDNGNNIQLNQHNSQLDAINQRLDENMNRQEETLSSLAKVQAAKRNIESITGASSRNGSFDSAGQMPSWSQSSLARVNYNNSPRLSSTGVPRGPRPEFQSSCSSSPGNSCNTSGQNHNISNYNVPNQNHSRDQGYLSYFQSQQLSPLNQSVKPAKIPVVHPHLQSSALNKAATPTHKRPVEDVIDLTLSDEEEPPNKR